MPRTDFFGGKHTYHRDADGLYTPPPYLFDEMSSEYDQQLVSGPPAAQSDTDKGMDGTVKHFVINGNERDCDTIQDRHGNRTVLAYSQSAAMPDGSTRHLLSSVTDPSGRSLNFTWTNFGSAQQPAWRITQVTGPQYSVTYGYYTDANSANAANELYNLRSVTLDPTGLNRTTTYTYTGVTGQDANGNNQTENGLLASVSDPLGHTVSYNYVVAFPVDNGTPYPDYYPTFTGTVWVQGVSESGGDSLLIFPGGSFGSPGYASYRMHAYTSGGLTYDCYTDQFLRTEFSGCPDSWSSYRTTYDTANNVLTKDAGTAGTNQGQPEWTGREAQFHDAKDRFTYGPHGNVLTHSIDGFSGVETTSYYNASKYFQKASTTDALGYTTNYDYFDDQSSPGNRGNVSTVRDARYGTSGKQFTYTYNQYGQKASETNLNGVVTQYTYGDQVGNLTQVVQDPNGLNRTTQMQYDVAGHVTQSTDPMGQVSTFDYNHLGQPVSATFPATASTPAETVSYTYGGNGRTETVTDNRGITSMDYEAGNDRVHSVTDPVTGTTSYTYGTGGERLTMTLPGGGIWRYTYLQCEPWVNGGPYPPDRAAFAAGPHYYRTEPKDDPNSMTPMLAKITDDQGREVVIHQDITGPVRETVYNQVYDQSGNLTGYCKTVNQMDHSWNTTHHWLTQLKTTWNWMDAAGYGQWHSRILSQNDYTYDLAGNRLLNTISSQPLNPDGTPSVDGNNNPILNSRTEHYTYDELSRLKTVDYGDGGTQTYSFDDMGNRLQKVDSGTGAENYTYDNANRLLTKNGQAYVNDRNGNTLTGGGRTNTWDSENRLTQCIFNNQTSSYVYGADGLRHRSVTGTTANPITTDYALDGQNVVQEMHTISGTLTPVATYLTGPSGPMYKRSVDGTIRWYVYDGLGSVVGEVDPSGVMTAKRGFDVYGATRSSSGTATSNHGFVGSLGHTSEDETGLIYMRARWYDAGVGRFVSEDPAGDGANWYSYCQANPVGNVDRDGKSVSSTIWTVILPLLGGCAWAADASPMFAFLFKAWAVAMGLDLATFIAMRSTGADTRTAIGSSAGAFAATLMVSLVLLGATLKPSPSPTGIIGSIGAFCAGYSAMLGATAAMLDIEVEMSTA